MKSYNCLQLTTTSNLCSNVLVTTCYQTTKSLSTLNFNQSFFPKPFFSIWRGADLCLPNFSNIPLTLRKSSTVNRRVSFKESNSSVYSTTIYVKTTSHSTNKISTTPHINSKSYSMLIFYLKSNMVGLSCRLYKTFLYNLHLTSTHLHTHGTSKLSPKFSKVCTANPIKYL